MVIALGACLAVVLIGLAFVPEPKEGQFEREVDYETIAESVKTRAEFPVVVPKLPKGWVANEAMFKPMGAPAYDTWYLSSVGPQRGWMTLRQADGDERWVESELDGFVEVSTNDIDGVTFTSYDGSDGKQAMVGQLDGSTAVLIGRADPQTYEFFAKQAVEQAGKQG
nr:DUF4245 domain-containing protein [Brevibacterium luteolum]